MTINPNLLNPDRYLRFGYDIKQVAVLSNAEIEHINNKIIAEENRIFELEKKPSLFKKSNLVLTTGNGFVDKLMIVSIVMTEIMIGVIIVSILGG